MLFTPAQQWPPNELIHCCASTRAATGKAAPLIAPRPLIFLPLEVRLTNLAKLIGAGGKIADRAAFNGYAGRRSGNSRVEKIVSHKMLD